MEACHTVCSLIHSTGTGRLKMYTKERVNILEKSRERKKRREGCTHHKDAPSQCSNFPKHLDCSNREKLKGNLSLHQDQCPLRTCPDTQQYLPFVISAAHAGDPALNRNCCGEQPPEKDHFNDPDHRCTSKARKHLLQLETSKTLSHCILHLEEWGLCEMKDTCHS